MMTKPSTSDGILARIGLLALLALTSTACGAEYDQGSVGSHNRELVAPNGIVSDDFRTGTLDTQVWQVIDPQGDSTVSFVGAGTPDAHMLLSVPAGTDHDAWTTNTALRVMQTAQDEDLELEVKFESEPTERYQSQGLLVEQDPSNYIRFDVYRSSSSLKVFAATFANGFRTIHADDRISSLGPVTYLRIGRSGDQWTAQYSSDGVSWSTAASFSHSLTVSAVGPFAGNYKPAPAFTAAVDYFYDTSAPIVSEDPPLCGPGDAFSLTTQATNGTILRSPDQASYGCGDVVTLTAQPDPGATFLGWGGALSGTTNPATVTMNADTTVTASFDLDVTPPQISNVSATPSATSATISWQTNEPSIGSVRYGTTTGYELGSVPSSTLTTAHAVTLPNLVEGETYHYQVTAEDGFGNAVSGVDRTFATSGGGGPNTGAVVSDDFHTGTLDTQLWQVVDPQGDGSVTLVGAGTPDAHLLLSVPAGTDHDAWTTNTALRVMQPAADEDFEIEVKFESQPTQAYQSQGLLVQQDASNYVRFDVYSNGGSLQVFTAKFTNGSPTIYANNAIAALSTTYLRLSRAGDQWTAQYSSNGTSWTTAASFSHPLTVSSAGPFAGNFNPAPAFTAVVDYFFDTSAPILSEDPPLCDPADPLVLTTQATNGTILRSPDQATYSCGDVVTLTAQPDFGATFLGWGGALSGTTNPATVTMNADTTVTASFDLDVSPPQISGVNAAPGQTSATVSWQTDELSIGSVRYGTTTGYELGSVPSSTLATAHAVTLPDLVEGETYHYQVTAEDSFGNSVTGADRTFTTTSAICGLTTQATNGTILRNPNAPSYPCGTIVTLTAQPNPGATFVGWGGALSGTANPTTVTVSSDITVTATFDVDLSPPVISNLSATAGETSATVSWQTDELSIGFVEYGLTTAYLAGSVESTSLSTTHSVGLTGLSPGQTYHYRVTVEDAFGNGVSSGDATFTTTSTGGGGGGAGGSGGSPGGVLLSDDFSSGPLDTLLWDVVDPVGDGIVEVVGTGTQDAQLLLTVPAGEDHDAWSNNTALRVMQPAADEDFEIEAKFESEPTQAYQSQGLLVEQDPTNYVRFDVYSGGGVFKAFVATFSNGSPTIYANDTIPAMATTYLRLDRSGNQWTARYSSDGVSWTTAATFSRTLTVSSAGVFAGNFNPAPAFTAVVDYFFDTSAPIDPEDGAPCDPSDQFTVTATSVGPGTVERSPAQGSYACGDVVTLTAQPDPGAGFLGWGTPPSDTTNPLTITVSADLALVANFQLDQTPPQLSSVNATVLGGSATISWETDEPTTGFVEYGLNPSYNLGPVPSSVSATTHAVQLTGLIEGQTYHYRVTAEDSAGNSTSGVDRTFTTTTGGPNLDIWYGSSQSFGALGNPQRWVNVLGQVADPDGLSVLTFSLNGGPPQDLSIGPFRRLAEPGDFNVEIAYQDLSPGNNTIQIRAVDGIGFETVKTVNVNYTAGNVWPLPTQVDWSTAAQITDVAQIVDGRWSIVGGELRNDLERYDRLVAIGDLAWTDYEVTLPVTVHSINPAGFGGINGAPGVGVFLRWTGHFDWNGFQPTYGYYPIGGGAWLEFASNGDGAIRLEDFTPGGLIRFDPLQRTISIGTRYIWKLRVESVGGNTTRYSMKIWVDGTPEPASWEIVGDETGDLPGGSLALVPHFADVSFGNIIIDPI